MDIIMNRFLAKKAMIVNIIGGERPCEFGFNMTSGEKRMPALLNVIKCYISPAGYTYSYGSLL
jgi:hypothetical protein